MHVDVLGTGDPRWDSLLRTAPHDFYSLPGYLALAGRHDDARPVAVLVEEGERWLLLPLLLRAIPATVGGDPALDATSPYGYSGITLSRAALADDAGFLGRAMAAVLDHLHSLGVVSLFVRLHPLLTIDAAPLARLGTVVDHGHTVSIDLGREADDLFPDLRRSHAKNLRRLDRLEFTCDIDESCSPESIQRFVDVYTETMDRLNATDSYYFDVDYVRDLIAALDNRVMIMLVRQGDEVAACGLFTEIDGIVQDHIGGTRNEFVPVAPSKLKIREAAQWAKRRGNRRLHLGGGLGGAEDQLFYFKSGFSEERHLFQTARFILDPARYAELNRRWADLAGEPVADEAGFFPPYRAPIPDLAESGR